MAIDRQRLRWNGWGWIEAPDMLGEHAPQVWAWMAKVFGVDPLPDTPAKDLADIDLPEPTLDAAVIEELGRILAPDRVKTDDFERALHARGRSYHDLLYLRAGLLDNAPDAVVYPQDSDETLALVRFANDRGIPLIPFGGGSSVVGGVNAAPGAVTVDMTLMDRVLSIDKEALVARVEAGIYGPQLEDALQAEGYTLGHYPQSFEFSTVGGWIAPRSAGHQSNKYGKAEHWTVSTTVATPDGLWSTEAFPGSAAGPQLRDMIIGSEGTMGIITEAEVRIHPVPAVKDYRGYVFADFAAGVAATRDMMQERVPTAMIRLSDHEETHFYHALHSGGAAGDDPVLFCLMLVGIEGDEETVEWARARSRAIVERHGGMHMGEELGEVWYKGRFEMPYLRDPMMDRGMGVDTLETATRWSNLVHLHDATVAAIKDAMAANAPAGALPGICLAHVSHSYRDGASLYFTFAFPRALDREVDQWLAIKKAASDTIVANGGTISHHHGVGVDHIPWIAREKGSSGMAALRAVKRAFDPKGILNPGKLID